MRDRAIWASSGPTAPPPPHNTNPKEAALLRRQLRRRFAAAVLPHRRRLSLRPRGCPGQLPLPEQRGQATTVLYWTRHEPTRDNARLPPSHRPRAHRWCSTRRCTRRHVYIRLEHQARHRETRRFRLSHIPLWPSVFFYQLALRSLLQGPEQAPFGDCRWDTTCDQPRQAHGRRAVLSEACGRREAG